jgi:hypothetical protein
MLVAAGVVDADTSSRDVDASVSIAEILRHLRALGDDAMEGRGTGTPGGERAAAYLESQLARLDLEPLGGGYRQAVPLHGSLPLAASRLTLAAADGRRRTLALWDDYVLFDTGAQTFLPQPVPLTFVAYGIVAPEFDYNDYQRADVSGRIAVFMAGEPPSRDPSYFDGERPTIHSDPEMKFRTALARGARGAILIPSPRERAYLDWSRVLDAFQTEDVTLPYGVAGSLNVLLRLEPAARLFNGAPTSLGRVLELDREGALGSFPLAARVSFAGAFDERDFVAHNLVARLPGADPLLRDRHVIVSAHYDHLGTGRAKGGDTIYNGVIDNASGTAVVLELARVLSSRPSRPRRSVLFLFVTGEEKGLLGSRFYSDHPVVPLHRTVAAVNVDGISFLDASDEFVGIGSAYSTLGELLEATLAGLGLRRAEVPALFTLREPFYESDQLAFAQAGIPAILVMEGLAFRDLKGAEGVRRFVAWGNERYHTPFDDLSQPLDHAAIEQHATVLLAFVERVADTPIEPQWLPGAPWTGERLRTMAEGR